MISLEGEYINPWRVYLRWRKRRIFGFHGNVNIKQPLLYYFSLFLQVCNVNNIIIIYNILAVRKGSNIIMVFNIHISVKSRKSVFFANSNKLFMGQCIPRAVKSYWKCSDLKLLYLKVGKGGFPGFHENVNI